LIVTIPHILAKYDIDKGKELLKEQFHDLLDYYNKKIIPYSKKFIEEHFLIKPRNTIRSLNDYLGEINNIIESGIQLEDTIDNNKLIGFLDKINCQ
jgi:bisphosphoglycerate-dependent phosphoglycerate mutase